MADNDKVIIKSIVKTNEIEEGPYYFGAKSENITCDENEEISLAKVLGEVRSADLEKGSVLERLDNLDEVAKDAASEFSGIYKAVAAATSKIKFIEQDSGNYSVSEENEFTIITVIDNRITENSHIDLYPNNMRTEEWLNDYLYSTVIDVNPATKSFDFYITENSFPSGWSMYYIITEVEE